MAAMLAGIELPDAAADGGDAPTQTATPPTADRSPPNNPTTRRRGSSTAPSSPPPEMHGVNVIGGGSGGGGGGGGLEPGNPHHWGHTAPQSTFRGRIGNMLAIEIPKARGRSSCCCICIVLPARPVVGAEGATWRQGRQHSMVLFRCVDLTRACSGLMY